MRNTIFFALILSLFFSCSAFKKQKQEIDSHKVLLHTTEGDITILLFEDVPLHSNNFIKLVKQGFYDSLLFHRVIAQFMIQGGDPDSKKAIAGQALGNGDVGYRIPAEFMVDKHVHLRGVIAMARDNNPEKASSGCQFYIVQGKIFTDKELDNLEAQKGIKYTKKQRKLYKKYGGTPHLDNDYTVFGEVLAGQDVVEAISKAPGNNMNRPNKDIRIISARMIK